MVLMNLSGSLTEVGRFRNSAEPLERSITVLNEVLLLASKERFPMQWANTKLNLSAALNSLGIATSEINCFERAILANNDALTVYTRDDHPLHWANCRWGIGTALKLTAERTQDAAQALAAVQILSEVYDILIRSDDERIKPRISGALSEAITLQEQLDDSREFCHRDAPAHKA
jgi:tetratricopeptide (TPR) repeat protein